MTTAGPQPAPQPEPEPRPPALDLPAADLLAGLRRRDPRLLLSRKDIDSLAPAVRAWLDRGIQPGQITRTLTAELPAGAVPRPARLLAYRLREWIPPRLPVPVERPAPPPVLPLRSCDGCERAIRSDTHALCRDCRTAAA
ncbi:hypothetical protein [Streptomyces luteireticuli]|uniref:hypothetical protein n=1 Tax=Streptomyces luteireticuli TaxID=173858 RepID=UPI0035570549